MKRRIEVWVDVDLESDQHFELLRTLIEDATWNGVHLFRNNWPSITLYPVMVQANEVEAPKE